MLIVVQSFGEDLPASCKNTCAEVYTVFDTLLVNYGAHYFISERACRVLRLGIQFFGDSALPVMPGLLLALGTAFDRTGFASFLWLQGKAVGQYGSVTDPAVHEAFRTSFETMSLKVFTMLKTQPPDDIPDGKLFIKNSRYQYPNGPK